MYNSELEVYNKKDFDETNINKTFMERIFSLGWSAVVFDNKPKLYNINIKNN